MLKKLCVPLLIIFVIVFSAPTTSAQESDTSGDEQAVKMIAPDRANPLFGQNHAYSVTFRGNGEAVVSSRIVFTNMEDAALGTLVLRVPKVEPQDIIAFQVIKEPRCLIYKPLSTGLPRPTSRECAEYGEPDYLNIWDGTTKYQKATISLSTDTLTITLPKPIKTQNSGSILLYFRAFGYAKKSIFGGYSYTFESLKSQQPIQNLQIGITTDSDLFLRGVKANVNYRLEAGVSVLKSADVAAAPMANQKLNTYYQQIGQGDIVKTATNLQPLDSYTIKGSYADSILKLYGREFTVGVGVTIVVAVILFFIVRALVKGGSAPQKQGPAVNTRTQSVLLAFGLSFISAFVIVAFTAGLVIVMRSLTQIFPYDSQMLVTALVVIVSFGVYGLFLFAPGLYMGLKRGLGYGLGTAGLTIVWLAMALIVATIVFLSSSRQTYPYRGATFDNGGIMPMIEKAVSGIDVSTPPEPPPADTQVSSEPAPAEE